jgi:hypothetical protein
VPTTPSLGQPTSGSPARDSNPSATGDLATNKAILAAHPSASISSTVHDMLAAGAAFKNLPEDLTPHEHLHSQSAHVNINKIAHPDAPQLQDAAFEQPADSSGAAEPFPGYSEPPADDTSMAFPRSASAHSDQISSAASWGHEGGSGNGSSRRRSSLSNGPRVRSIHAAPHSQEHSSAYNKAVEGHELTV